MEMVDENGDCGADEGNCGSGDRYCGAGNGDGGWTKTERMVVDENRDSGWLWTKYCITVDKKTQ